MPPHSPPTRPFADDTAERMPDQRADDSKKTTPKREEVVVVEAIDDDPGEGTDDDGAAVTWLDFVCVTKEAQAKVFDLPFQTYLYLIFHRSSVAQAVHALGISAVVWSQTALVDKARIHNQKSVTGSKTQ